MLTVKPRRGRSPSRLTAREMLRNLQLEMAKTNRRRAEPWVGPWLRVQRESDAEKKRPGSEMDDVARRLKRSKASISRIETGRGLINADDLLIVLRAYRRTLDDLASAVRQKAAA